MIWSFLIVLKSSSCSSLTNQRLNLCYRFLLTSRHMKREATSKKTVNLLNLTSRFILSLGPKLQQEANELVLPRHLRNAIIGPKEFTENSFFWAKYTAEGLLRHFIPEFWAIEEEKRTEYEKRVLASEKLRALRIKRNQPGGENNGVTEFVLTLILEMCLAAL